MSRDVNDPNKFTEQLQTQLDMLREINHTEDRDAILAWAHSQLGQEFAPATLISRFSNIRLLHDRAETALVDFEAGDLDELLARFGDGSHPSIPEDGLSSGSLRMYRQAAKLFFRDGLGREWAEDIVIGKASPTPIGPDDILTTDELDALLEAGGPRDRALAAFLAMTGQRITAALSIRVGDVDLSGGQGTVRLNDDALGLKGASGPRPLLWARPFVAGWLAHHPAREGGDAPLFCATQGGWRPSTDGGRVEWEAGDPLTRTHAKNRLVGLAEDAGVSVGKVKPHNFRHTAITRMRDQGIPDDRIKWMVGVAPESDILERYDKATNEKMLSRIRSDFGMAPEEETPVGRPTIAECPSCTGVLRGTEDFCPSCGTPLDMAAVEVDQASAGVMDYVVEADSTAKRAAARDMAGAVDADDELRKLLVEALTSE